ncbi:MAG: AAA family ATPase [bacterium]
MNVKGLFKALELSVKSGRPLMIVGGTGVGKSSIVRQFCHENNIEMFDLRLATQEPGDLIGLPVKVQKDGRTVTEWAVPSWLDRLIEVSKERQAIIFMDEFNRGTNDVQQACFQLVLDRRLHTIQLNDNVHIVVAINPDDGQFMVNAMDPALRNRFWRIDFKPTAEEWLSWARDAGIHESIMSYISADRMALNLEGKGYDSEVFPTPRSWHMLSDIMNAMGDVDLDELTSIASGIIGAESAIAFVSFLKSGSQGLPFTVEQIFFDDYSRLRARLEAWKRGRTDLIAASLNNVLRYLRGEVGLARVGNPNVALGNLTNFIRDVPREMAFAFLSGMAKNPDATPVMRKVWDALSRDDVIVEMMWRIRKEVGGE